MNNEEFNNEVINKLIKELADLNIKLNSKDKRNIQKNFDEVENDERDLIIETILSDDDFIKFTEIQSKKMAYYYGKNVEDFRLIVTKLLNVLIKNYQCFTGINNPKGHLLSYCFRQPIGKNRKTFPNRIWTYFHRYFHKFEEMKGHKSLEQLQLLGSQGYDQNDLDYWESNKFYAEYFEHEVNKKDRRGNAGSKKVVDNTEEIDSVNFEEIMGEIKYLTDEEILLISNKIEIPDDDDEPKIESTENHSTLINTVITKYDIPYIKERLKNITMSDAEYNEVINEIRKNKLRRWHRYNKLTAVYPHDIFRYHPGNNEFKLREDSKSKKIDHIYAKCIIKKHMHSQNDGDIDYIKIKEYIKRTIDKTLTKREQQLIRYLYYEMLPAEKIIDLLGFKNKKALNTEKSDCIGKIRRQMMEDYEVILNEYNGTRLTYWTKKIIRNHKNKKAEKVVKKLSI